MPAPGEGNIVSRILGYTISLILESLSLINPGNVSSVFKDVKPMPTGFLRLYLFIIALPIFIGYFLYFNYFQILTWSFENSFKVALRYYITAAVLPMIMAYVLYLFDERLVKVKVTQEEALTLFTYAMTPALLSGIFKTSSFTFIVHILAIMYSVYLVYAALETRYGEDRSVVLPFTFVMLTGMFASLVVLVLLTAVFGISGYYW